MPVVTPKDVYKRQGLSAAIINPNSEAMMKSYYAYCAISGSDLQCTDYINQYAGQQPPPAQTAASALTLKQAVMKGLSESAREAAKIQLEQHEAPVSYTHLEIVRQFLLLVYR